jgi:hypothetical protein
MSMNAINPLRSPDPDSLNLRKSVASATGGRKSTGSYTRKSTAGNFSASYIDYEIFVVAKRGTTPQPLPEVFNS